MQHPKHIRWQELFSGARPQYLEGAHEKRGEGFYAMSPEECASRRVDLRGPTDRDPGPIALEEAPEDIDGIEMRFAG